MPQLCKGYRDGLCLRQGLIVWSWLAGLEFRSLTASASWWGELKHVSRHAQHPAF